MGRELLGARQAPFGKMQSTPGGKGGKATEQVTKQTKFVLAFVLSGGSDEKSCRDHLK